MESIAMRCRVCIAGDVKMQLKLTSKAADCIATGDIIESVMRHDQSWSMLPVLGMMSTILPCDFIRGGMQGMINFPSFLGKLSTQGSYFNGHHILGCQESLNGL